MDVYTQTSKYTLPQRVVLSICGFLAVVNAYTMRYCLDTALSDIADKMGEPKTLSGKHSQLFEPVHVAEIRNATHQFFKRFNLTYFSINLFNETLHANGLGRVIPNDSNSNYQWSNQMQTIILSSFYVGYIVSNIPGGLLAERYGGKWVLVGAIFGTAILTIITPFTIEHGGPVALILIRILIGMTEGPTFPALNALLSNWIPAKERGKLGVLALSGGQIGIVLVNVLSGLLISKDDWKLLFYFFGGCGLLWCFSFIILCYDEPESSPFISEEEKEYLQNEISNLTKKHNNLSPTPWKDILRNPPMWALISSTIQYNWTQSNLMNKLNGVLRKIHETNSSLKDNIITSLTVSIPCFINWIVSLISGWLSDILINYGIISVTDTRRLMSSIAAIAPNMFTNVSSCLSTKDGYDVFDVVNCTLGVMGAYFAGVKLSPLDLSPNYAPILTALADGMGSIINAIAPFMDDLANANPIIKEFRSVLWFVSTILMSGEVQSYNDQDAGASSDI